MSVGYTAYNPDRVNSVITLDTPYQPNAWAKASVEVMDNAHDLYKKGYLTKGLFQKAVNEATRGWQDDYNKIVGLRDLAGQTDALEKIRDQWNSQQANGQLKSVKAYAIATDSYDSLSVGGTFLLGISDAGIQITGHGDYVVSVKSQSAAGFNGISTYTIKPPAEKRNTEEYNHEYVVDQPEMIKIVERALGLSKGRPYTP